MSNKGGCCAAGGEMREEDKDEREVALDCGEREAAVSSGKTVEELGVAPSDVDTSWARTDGKGTDGCSCDDRQRVSA